MTSSRPQTVFETFKPQRPFFYCPPRVVAGFFRKMDDGIHFAHEIRTAAAASKQRVGVFRVGLTSMMDENHCRGLCSCCKCRDNLLHLSGIVLVNLVGFFNRVDNRHKGSVLSNDKLELLKVVRVKDVEGPGIELISVRKNKVVEVPEPIIRKLIQTIEPKGPGRIELNVQYFPPSGDGKAEPILTTQNRQCDLDCNEGLSNFWVAINRHGTASWE